MFKNNGRTEPNGGSNNFAWFDAPLEKLPHGVGPTRIVEGDLNVSFIYIKGKTV